MREFLSDDSFVISRGQVYTFVGDKVPEDLYDPCQMLGETVKIDGVEYKVRGVETFCIPRSPERPYRSGFGILV